MPTCRRKRVVLTEPPEPLLEALKSDPNRQVFYLEQTGEIFETFEYVLFSFLAHILSINYLFIEHMPPACLFTVSGNFNARSLARAGLITFKQSKVRGKKLRLCMQGSQNLSNLLSLGQFNGVCPFITFPLASSLKPLSEVMGRLDHLVEAVYERFKDRYFKGERALWIPLFM